MVLSKPDNVQYPKEVNFDKRRLGDNAFVVADNSLAKSTLKWVPKKTMEDICRDGWRWQLNNPNGY